MAQMPIEVVTVGNVPIDQVGIAVSLANSTQSEFRFLQPDEGMTQAFKVLAYRRATSKDFKDGMEKIRSEIGGYHPFIIAVVDTKLESEQFSNLFGSHRADHGVAVFTIDGVEPIVPSEKLAAYMLYYFARYALSFAAPEHKNHTETKDCVFDRKVFKPDIIKSMKARAICDECRDQLLAGKIKLSPAQLNALDRLFETSGKVREGIISLSLDVRPSDEPDLIDELTKIKNQLDMNAYKFAQRGLWIYLAVVLVIWLGLAGLTFRLGWDKTEPWTFFIGAIVPILSYIYFVVTQREISPKTIYDQIVELRKRKIYQQTGFDIAKYEELLTSRK